jgi:hypothetical protein
MAAALASAPALYAQASAKEANAIAVVQLGNQSPGAVPTVTGPVTFVGEKAILPTSGEIAAGSETTQVVMPHRGILRVCATTSVKLAADSSVPSGGTPGLLMALDHGAVEISFATGRDTDILLTPDFRLGIGGPGARDVKVRLGSNGDTCVDNSGTNAPYVLITSVFDGSEYRVEGGQHVLFEHGSIHEVVDREKETCGCPPAEVKGNEFPLAQSEGLALLPPPPPPGPHAAPAQSAGAFVYNSTDHPGRVASHTATGEAPGQAGEASPNPQANAPTARKKKGFFSGIGHFFRKVFGANQNTDQK